MHINERGQQVFVGEEAIKGFLSRLARLREGGPGSGRHPEGKSAPSKSSKTDTNSPEFKKWFSGSKIVDPDGKPKIVYHGTSEAFSKVDMGKGAQGIFWVASDKSSIQSGESGAVSSKTILPMYVQLKNPAGWKEYENLMLVQIKNQGYDGVILPDKDGTFNAIVFKPDQVRIIPPDSTKESFREGGPGSGRHPEGDKKSGPIFSHEPDEGEPSSWGKDWKSKRENVKLERVALKDLIPVQSDIDPRTGKSLRDEIEGATWNGSHTNPNAPTNIVVVRHNGKLFLADGHHRAGGAILDGKTHMNAYVYTLPSTTEESNRDRIGSFMRENRKLHARTEFQGLPISVENRIGSVRKGEDEDGKPWETKMHNQYGYIKGTEGVDGDALDVFIGPDEHAAFAYIAHCQTSDGKDFDEDKVMLGFPDRASAERVFHQHYDDPKYFGGMDEIPMWKFREKVWIKKYTTQKLVASMRESFAEGGPGSGRHKGSGGKENVEPSALAKSLKYSPDTYGSSGGQRDSSIYARDPAGRLLGKVDYSVYENEVQIKMVEVVPSLRRQGIGSELIRQLRKEEAGRKVDWGMTTTDGSALKKAMGESVDRIGNFMREGGPGSGRHKEFKIAAETPEKTAEVQSAITNTAGATHDEKGLTLDVVRYQKEEQAGERSLRTGVFFLPEKNSPYKRYYTTGKNGYGGKQKIEGRTTFENPMIVKGASGGKVPERAYDEIKGKNAYAEMRNDVLDASGISSWQKGPKDERVQRIADVLEKYGGKPDLAEAILDQSKEGNTLAYAIQEHIVASTLRAAGHDAIIGYTKIKGQPRLSEVFDVTRDKYPLGIASDFSAKDSTKESFREGGPGSGRHKEEVEKGGAKLIGEDEDLVHFHDPVTNNSYALRPHEVTAENVKKKIDKGRQEDRTAGGKLHPVLQDMMKRTQYESEEHGVKGMHWGVTNPRKDAPLQRKAAQAQPNRTLNQMDVGKGLNRMAHTNNNKAVAVIAQRQNQANQQALQQIQQKQQVQAQQAQQRGQRPPQPQQSHSDALEMLANLGFKLLDVAAPLLGLEGAEEVVKSVVMSPYGKKLLFTTNKNGQHQLSPDGGHSPTQAQNTQRAAPARRKKSIKTSAQPDRIDNFMREGGPGSGPHPGELRDQALKMASPRQKKIIHDGEAQGKQFIYHQAELGGCYNQKSPSHAKPTNECPGVAVINRKDRVHIAVCDGPTHYEEKSKESGVKGMKWGIHDLGKDHDIPSQEGYVYHATNAERAHDIAQSGKLETHKPSFGTDQSEWPDGATEKRSYFSNSASGVWAFSPEEGKAAILRTKMDPAIHKKESTGDIYSKKSIPASKLEILGDDKEWHPLTELGETKTQESQSFDSRMGRFLREAKKKKKIYYSRPMNRYKTQTEAKNLGTVHNRFPKAKIKYPRTKKHDELGMEYFHDQIDEADRVVLKPDRGTRLTTGVYSEARHAIKNRIPVYALYKGKMRKVRSVKTLKHPNKEGHFGRIIFRKKKRRK